MSTSTWVPNTHRRGCSVAGCRNTADQEHHMHYGRGYPDDWNRVWICRDCHRLLHAVYDEYCRHHGMPLALFSHRYITKPELTIAKAGHLEPVRPRVIEPIKQLSLGDVHGRQGDYWRRWEAEVERAAKRARPPLREDDAA